MPCSKCSSDFNLFNWKIKCGECDDKYCHKCLKKREGILYCDKCIILINRPPDRVKLMELKPKELRAYLAKNNISTYGVVEKQELVDLLCSKQIPDRPKKGVEKLTANIAGGAQINDFIDSVISATTDQRSSKPKHPTTQSNKSSPSPRYPPPRTDTELLHSPAHDSIPTTSSPPSQRTTLPPQSNTTSPQSTTTPPQSTTTPPQNEPPPSGWIPEVVPSLDDLATTSTVWVQVSEDTNILNVEQKTELNETPDGSPLPPRYPKLSDFKSEEDLTKLSSRQMKQLLSLNRVDFKGCVEKAELLERAQRLWTDNHELTKELPEDSQELCKICLDGPLDCVLLECGHIATCIECGKRLSECPICRQYVVRVVRTFKA